MSHLSESLGEVTVGHKLCLMMSLMMSEVKSALESVGDSYGIMLSVNKLICLRLFMIVLVWACLLCSRTSSCGRHVGDLSCDPGRCWSCDLYSY